MEEYRPWHLPACPARDAAVALGECKCPAERFLSDAAEPILEAEDGKRQRNHRLRM